jgi:outer membrane protein OmpA-like peptidoglycan-associated protein
MSFSSTSGVLRGSPTSAGTTSYTITGFNNSGSVSSSCTITVSTSSSSDGPGGSALALNLPQPKSLTSTVYFAPNSSLLDKASKKTLRELVLKLKNAKASSIRIDGHADQIVGLIPNSKLATDRAKAVAKYLRARVANSTFLVRAFSAKRPAILGESVKAYSMNRRAGLSVSFRD